MTRPTPKSSLAEKEIDRLDKEFNQFNDQVKALTLDNMNAMAKRVETEPQTKLSSQEIEDKGRVVIKPTKSIGSREKFNERFRSEYEYLKEPVHFIAENKEIIGESIEMWTKPFAGMDAQFWEIPTNTPVWAPRFVAEQIKRKNYHRLIMKQNHVTNADGYGQYYGAMAADSVIHRLDAMPVSTRKSFFMGDSFKN